MVEVWGGEDSNPRKTIRWRIFQATKHRTEIGVLPDFKDRWFVAELEGGGGRWEVIDLKRKGF